MTRTRHGNFIAGEWGVDDHVPFGGRKASSYGPREQDRYAVELYTSVKTAYIAA